MTNRQYYTTAFLLTFETKAPKKFLAYISTRFWLIPFVCLSFNPLKDFRYPERGFNTVLKLSNYDFSGVNYDFLKTSHFWFAISRGPGK